MAGLIDVRAVVKVRSDREQTAHLQTALLRLVGADPDTNRSAGLHSIRGFGRDCRHAGLVEFTGCRSDLSMHLREHVFGGRVENCVVGLVGGRVAQAGQASAAGGAAAVR